MTPDELRALADALEPIARAPRFEDFDVPAICAWMRACADAQPVAWRTYDGEGNYNYCDYELNEDWADEWNRRNPNHVGWVEPLYTHPAPAVPHYAMLDSHRRLVEQAIQSAEHPSGMSTHDGKARIDASILRRMLAIIDSLSAVPAGWKLVPVDPTPEMLASTSWPGCAGTDYAHMLAAAPAVPQAEPCIGNNPACPCQDGDACHYKDAADGTKAWPVPQAEPKREPLSDERIAEIQRAAYERAEQVCIETAAELRRCADGCTDGRYDWKADGAADCADAISALGRQ